MCLTFAVAVSYYSQKAKSLIINMSELKCCHLSLKTGLWRELPELSPNASPGADTTRDVCYLCSFLIALYQWGAFLLWVGISHCSWMETEQVRLCQSFKVVPLEIPLSSCAFNLSPSELLTLFIFRSFLFQWAGILVIHSWKRGR